MGFSLRKFWKNWNDRYRYQQTPEGKAETKAKRDVAAAKAKERKDKREKQAREGIGYKKPYSAHSPSFSFTLECGHQILTSEWSGTGLLGKKVLCEVCNERRTVTDRLPRRVRNR